MCLWHICLRDIQKLSEVSVTGLQTFPIVRMRVLLIPVKTINLFKLNYARRVSKNDYFIRLKAYRKCNKKKLRIVNWNYFVFYVPIITFYPLAGHKRHEKLNILTAGEFHENPLFHNHFLLSAIFNEKELGWFIQRISLWHDMIWDWLLNRHMQRYFSYIQLRAKSIRDNVDVT